MLRAYKYRIYPTAKQAELINKHIGACRLVYNLALDVKMYAYKSQRISLTAYELMSQLPELKKEYTWLNEIDSQCLQQAIMNMANAFKNFFKGNGYPKFKSRNKGTQSFRNPHGSKVQIIGSKIKFPKFLEGIKIAIDREHKGKIRSSTVSMTPTGKYYVSVLCETGEKLPEKKAPTADKTIGIDIGLSNFAVTSDGTIISNPKYLKQSLERLKVLQRRLSRKKKGSTNRKKAQHRVAVMHEKIANQRKDFIHKLSSQLVSSHDAIVMEDLNISGMMKNHKLAQGISDVGWGMFVESIKYKSEWSGKHFYQIPRFEPSTKKCGNCGILNQTLTLATREWICAECGTLHDRDKNAADNIKQYFLTHSPKVTRGVPVEQSALADAMKQEDVH